MARKMHLTWFGAAGPGGDAGNWMGTTDGHDWRYPEIYRDIAQLCERACFDMFFLADGIAMPEEYGGSMDYYLQKGLWAPLHDPIPIIGYLAGITRHLGLVSTISTSITHPFTTARLLSTLDHFSRGRVGWNVVTSSQKAAAQNMGQNDLIAHDQRYDVADEYMALCRQLWSAWDGDALLLDRGTGTFADPGKVRRVDFAGEHFRSRGPLPVPPSPQGTPTIISAGMSPRGRRFASEHADATLVELRSLDALKAFSKDLRARTAAAGRDPRSCKIMALTRPIIGETRAIAEARREWQTSVMDPQVGLATMSLYTGHDLSQYDLDKPLPDLDINAIQSLIAGHTKDGVRPTLRQIALTEMRYDGYPLCGTAEDIADAMMEAVEEADIDGFFIRTGLQNITELTTFVDKVVPILQERGVARHVYTGETLRDHLHEF